MTAQRLNVAGLGWYSLLLLLAANVEKKRPRKKIHSGKKPLKVTNLLKNMPHRKIKADAVKLESLIAFCIIFFFIIHERVTQARKVDN